MTKIALWVLTSVLISAMVYFAIVAFLIISEKQRKSTPGKDRLAFGELLIDYKGLPQLKTSIARDGKQLSYRLYPARRPTATRSTAAAPSSGGSRARASPSDELDGAAFALARRVAMLPGNQLHMMKVLVNQAFEQMGLHTTQLIGTLLDGASRHTPEGAAFTRPRRSTCARRSASATRRFGDYGEGPRTV